MWIQRKMLVLLILNIIFLQYHGAIKCNYNKEVLFDESHGVSFGQAIKKHVRNTDAMSMLQCQCTDQTQVILKLI